MPAILQTERRTKPAEHRWYARGGAVEVWNARDPEVLISGPAGTGKSRAVLEKLHAICMNPKVRDVQILVCRKTMRSLASSAVKTYRTRVAVEALERGAVYFHGGGPQDPPQYRYSNGSAITLAGLDKPDKIMSTEFDVIYVQEATECDIEDWEKLLTRLRNYVLSYQQIIADCNPDAPTHWLKARCDAGKTRMIFSRHEDNPLLFDSGGELTAEGIDYIDKLENLSGARYLRLRHGQWVAAEGQVYDEWMDHTHLVNQFKIPEDWPRFWSIDFGYTNPFVLQMWAQDPDGRLYLYREIYQTRRLVEEHCKQALDLVAPPERDEDGNVLKDEDDKPIRTWKEPKPRWVVCDHDAEGRETARKHLGLPMRNAKKEVQLGIQTVQKRIKPAGDGRPRLFLMRDATVRRDRWLEDLKRPTSTQAEVAGYVWDPSSSTETDKEEPLKENDHGMDALRYLVMQVDKGGSPGVRQL